MHKIARKLSAAMVALFTAFTALSYMPAQAATVVPKVQYVESPKLEYTAGDRVQFNLYAPNYGGRVQYRVVLWDNNKKQMRDLWNTGDRYYTNWQPYGNNVFTLGWPITEPGSYRITIYAKRAGVANSNTALKGFNCDSYMESAAFVVKPAAAPASDAAVKAVAAYEVAPLTTLEQITAAEALKAAATTAVASVEDAAKKAELTAKIAAQDVKVAAAKEVVGYVHVSNVAAINKTTVKVTFDKEVAPLAAKNFNISDKEDQYLNLLVKSVALDATKKVATVELYDELVKDTDYTVQVKDVTSVDGKVAMKEASVTEVKFVEAAPASIAIKATKVLVSGEEVNTLGYVIKDANGNDITNNFTFVGQDSEEVEDGSVIVETTATDVVDYDLSIGTEANKYAIVNILVKGTTVATGNTIITTVAPEAAKLTAITSVDFGKDADKNSITYLYKGLDAAGKTLEVALEDQNGDEYVSENTVEIQYISSNPAIAVVDRNTGLVTPVSVGKVYITAIVTEKDAEGVIIKRLPAKQVEIEVKADPKAAKIEVSKTSAKLVLGSGINEDVEVVVYDQYGNVFDAANEVVKVSVDKTTILEAIDEELTLTNGKVELSDITAAAKGTAKITFAYGTFKAYLTVSVVEKGAFAGYQAVVSKTTLDLNADADSKYSKGPQSVEVKVYEKDVNGNYIGIVNNFTVEATKNTDGAIEVAGAEVSAVPETVGTAQIAVKVNSVTVGTFTITVVDSTPVLSKVVVTDRIVVNAGDDITEALIGVFGETKYTEKGAIIGYDQYGNEFEVTADDITLVSTNSAVVDGFNAVGKGTATLVVTALKNIYMIEVGVK